MTNRPLRRFALPLLALCAWVLVLSLASRAGDFMKAVSVTYGEEQGVSPTQILRDERYAAEDGKENLPTQTIWKEEKNQQLADEAEGRFATAAVLTCFGSGDDLYPTAFLFGSWPARGDTQGIALDTAAANALWGGIGGPGQTVRWNGKTYALRGVFEGDKGLAMVQDGGDSETRYPNHLIQMYNTDDSNVIQMYNTNGGTVLDLPFLSWMLSAIAFLPGLILMAAILLRLLGRGWKLRYSPLLLSQYLLPGLAMSALTLWAAGFPWEIPAKMIPTRFSDLDFWAKLAGEMAGGVTGVLTNSMTSRDLALWTPVLFCLLALPIACGLTLAALRRAKAESLNTLLVGGLAAMVAAYGAAMVLGVNLDYPVLALPVLWLGADLALHTHGNLLKPKQERGEAYEALEASGEAALGSAGE